eukprot:m.128854 g.128854  ORF g.128854 m.128854 type:complete len:1133 (+) comp13879_c0_seq1:284-3682(+)
MASDGAPAMVEAVADSMYTAQELPEGKLDDLSKLTSLDESTLLHEIKVRFEQDKIYTYVGDILIAVNPFKALPLYSDEVAADYINKQASDNAPHVYAIADACYYNLFTMKKNQCAVISGESGAGKTVSAKHVIRHIINVSSAGETAAVLENRIIQVSPLLEAFGNAQTTMNDNSSRFGKYTRLLFDSSGHAMGVQISEYLLEKSRVVEQHEKERNFHVFYYLFASEFKDEFGLTSPQAFPSLAGGEWPDNAAMYAELLQAMKDVGFNSEEIKTIHKTLAAVLHLSNIDFEAVDEDSCQLSGSSADAVTQLTKLLGVAHDLFMEAVTFVHTVTRGESIKRPYTKSQSYDTRDATAKAIYQRLFSWIVSKVNEKLAPELGARASARPGVQVVEKTPSFEIGVLDIFGFENFASNGFEQLCINVAHEQLQFFFNQHTFRLELTEYEAEGVDGNAVTISFTDNAPLLDMCLAKPLGIFALLDEECTFPRATDQSFVDKIDTNFASNDFYTKILKSRGFPAFTIKHFPGDVEYNATHFLEKNRDNLAADVLRVLQNSSVPLVHDSFSGEVTETGHLQLPPQQQLSRSKLRRGEEVTQDTSINTANKKAPSLGTQFKNSLSDLVKKMTSCFPHFIRCIKPNQQQAPLTFDDDFVQTQLGYTGVLEATRIRREGFSWRPTFSEFVRRFKILAFPTHMLARVQENAHTARKILEITKLDPVLVGKTKLFLKWYHKDEMEAKLKAYYDSVIRVQSAARALFAKRIYKVRLLRAQMSEKERQEAEAKEREEQRRREEARIARERQESAAKAAEAARQAELAKLAIAQAEAEASAAREVQRTRELELERVEAAARQAEAEATRVAELARIQEKRISEERAIAQAEMAEEERAKALAEAAAAREAELRAIEEAHQLKEAKAKAEADAEAVRLQRAASIARREEMAAVIAREVEEKNDKVKELEKMLEDARTQAKDAEMRAMKVEAALALEEQTQQDQQEKEVEQQRAADVEAESFSFLSWLANIREGAVDEFHGVSVNEKNAEGPVSKTGQSHRAWKSRWFVVDLDDKAIIYYSDEKKKKERGRIDCTKIVRVFQPKNAATKATFLIETEDRTFFCKTTDEQATAVWIDLLSVFPRKFAKASTA